ncbi:MAG: outer membrane beta-barrel protein [Phocaeicola sp.]
MPGTIISSCHSGISLDVDLGFDTPGDNENTKVEECSWFANISLYKSFLKDRLSVQLKAYDLFNSYQAKSTVYSGNRLMTGRWKPRRNIGTTLRYTASMLPRASIKELELAIARRAVCKTIKIIKMEKIRTLFISVCVFISVGVSAQTVRVED